MELQFLIFSAVIYVIIETVKKIFLIQHNRFLPIIPLVIGGIGGPFIFTDETVYMSVAIGILAGALSGQAYKVARTTLMDKK